MQRLMVLLFAGLLAGCMSAGPTAELKAPFAGNEPLAQAHETTHVETAALAHSQLTVVYLGAEDCAACQRFEAYEEAAFKQKVAERGMQFREFHVGSHRYIKDLHGWPSDLLWLHDQLGSKAGTPWFFLIQGRDVISASQSYNDLISS
jgi:hypothetical protein